MIHRPLQQQIHYLVHHSVPLVLAYCREPVAQVDQVAMQTIASRCHINSNNNNSIRTRWLLPHHRQPVWLVFIQQVSRVILSSKMQKKKRRKISEKNVHEEPNECRIEYESSSTSPNAIRTIRQKVQAKILSIQSINKFDFEFDMEKSRLQTLRSYQNVFVC